MATTIPAPLAGRTAIVTGGSRGIGAGIAVDLVLKGCSAIAITYANNKGAADSVLEKIQQTRQSIKAVAIHADLLSPTFGPDLVNAALEQLGVSSIDIVVANAAVAEMQHFEPVASGSKANFEKIMAGNVWSPLQLALAAFPHMRAGGRIINISSVASKRGNADPLIIYGASKAALDSITRSLALNFAPGKKITINGVHVGPTATDAMKSAHEKLPKALIDVMTERPSAEKRMGEVQDIVGIVSFLASDEARWINGNLIPANGGAMLELQG
jgi:3-oxoacyl-[acyl-carrier protein] reductase